MDKLGYRVATENVVNLNDFMKMKLFRETRHN